MKRAFGFPDPLQDARRVRTAQMFTDGMNQTDLTGGGLENKIWLWQPDGSPIITYTPDEAGITAACVAARDGGKIQLPSIKIDLTAALTLPLGVTMRGISRDGSILSFTGLSAASAIVHSARSTLDNVTVIVDGAQPLIGVDARAARACVRHVAVYMADDANNIKVYAGYPEA